ncbi:unnamed protein product [Ambrosiozyma monospora]|uniref:Unnamed protein product n=1 Tax=Ambrosiozyma monospora TaxID=43982 RepID=A0A9W6YUS0_AMBMO|nr:unnamed protein product [Ambrosiozyma monospora]
MTSVTLPPIENNKVISKAITFQNHSTPWELTSLKLPVASPESIVQPDQILIKTAAVALNPVDILLRELTPRRFVGSSIKVAGADFSGTILQIGSSVETDLKVGDKVFGNLLNPFSQNNSFTEYILQKNSTFQVLQKVPEQVSLVDAAGLGVVSNTSYQAFKGSKNLDGGNVLILGGGSSVGYFGIQWAKYFGAKNIVVTASSSSSESALQAGATQWIDYKKGKENEFKETKEIVQSIGKFDLIFDTIRDDTLHSHFCDILKTKPEGGKLVIVAGSFSHAHAPRYLDMVPSIRFVRTVVRSMIRFSSFDVEVLTCQYNKTYAEDFAKLASSGNLRIKTDSVFNFYTEYQEAYNKLRLDQAKGKIILTLGEDAATNT